MKKLHIHILTPERTLYEGDADQVILPTISGEITALPDHVPLVSLLQPHGEVTVKYGDSIIPMLIFGGFIDIYENRIRVLADTAEKVEEIDAQRADDARKRAEEALVSKELDAQEYAHLSAQLQKDLMRLRVAKKYMR